MFDAKSILEGIVRNASAPKGQPGGASGDGSIADVLSDILVGGGKAATDGNQSNGGLGDILGRIQEGLNKSGGISQSGGGGVADILGQILNQATTGAKEGATRIGEATGATNAARDAIGRASGGQTPEELLARLKELVQQNPFAAGAAAGGLGGILLGTRTGRALAGGAARIGALALIGGLAYKAYHNYQAGKPLISDSAPTEAPPKGSGFEPTAVSNDAAMHFIEAMIAAAAADGRIDAAEQEKIIGGLKQAGIDAEAESFLADALNNPKTVAELAGAVASPQEAIQLYTAARIAIEVNSPAEAQFLANLANALGIDPKLAAHIEASAKGAAG